MGRWSREGVPSFLRRPSGVAHVDRDLVVIWS